MIYLLPSGAWIIVILIALLFFAKEAGQKLLRGTDEPPKLDPISLRQRVSSDGSCHIEQDGYYAPMKKYVATVVGAEEQYNRMLVADTQEELEKMIEKEFRWQEERHREQTNKRAVRERRYFQIAE